MPESTEFPVTQTAGYELSPAERGVMQSINLSALNAKARIYDLQAQLEQARADLAASQNAFTGAVALLGNSHGISNATISQDFSRIVPQGAKS